MSGSGGRLTGWEEREIRRAPGVPPADRPGDDRPLQLLVQRLDEQTGPVRAHFDLAASDQQTEVERHRALGATVGLVRRRLGGDDALPPVRRTASPGARPECGCSMCPPLASVRAMTSIERVDPPLAIPEADTLLAFLDYHRDTLRMKIERAEARSSSRRPCRPAR